MTIDTDYLIIGAGTAGLAFADEMLDADPTANMVLIDRRAAPGGHWNDAYPFVNLHQPSVFYGVGSRELGSGRIDEKGPNAGYMSLASGPEVLHYFHAVMRERLEPSKRVAFLPFTEECEDGSFRSTLNGSAVEINVRRKIIDGAYMTNSVPRTHTRNYEIADGIVCAPPNDLPAMASEHEKITVLGAGKTAIDTCVFLLTNGFDPDRIRWVIPRDPWLWNRAMTQPGASFFEQTFNGMASMYEAYGEAQNGDDLARRLEEAGVWLRIDPTVTPEFFHAATVAQGELDEVRRIKDVVRLGRVTRIEPDRLVLERGEVPATPKTLYVDCTARAIAKLDTKTVFDGDRITLQMIRFPQIGLSSAFIARLEAKLETDAEKNQIAAPIPLPDTPGDMFATMIPDMMNRYNASQNPEMRDWLYESRLDGFTKAAAETSRNDPDKKAILERIKAATMKAVPNMMKLQAEAQAAS